MSYYTIFVNGKAIGGDFGLSAKHAIERYAAGSTYTAADMTACLGVLGRHI